MYANIKKRPRPRVASGRKSVHVPLIGTLDIVTQDMKRNPGTASIALNYEPGIEDGFRRIDGYEAFDGRAAPSDALWHVVELTDASGRAIGGTLIGAGGASGVIVLIDGNRVAITLFNGIDYVAAETTNGVGNVVEGQLQGGSLPSYGDMAIELAAQNYYRALVGTLPGSGSVLGVQMHMGAVYGFRNNAGGTAAVLHRSSGTGWVEVPIYYRLRFSTGSSAYTFGEAITSSSGGVGVVKKAVVTSGAWGTSNAAGYLLIAITSGTFLSANTLGGGGVATATENATQITILPSGKYQFWPHNFYGQNATYSVYGCDNVNTAFEIDQNHVYTPIYTATTPDKPKYIVAQSDHLMMAIESSLIHSEPGVPYGYNGANGAGEWPVGAPITGLRPQPGSVLSIATLRNTWGFYGSNINDFRLDQISIDAGAFDYSYVSLGFPFGVNDQGVVAQQRVNAYGNFEASTISRMIQPIIDSKKSLLTASSVVRKRNQIRFYFSDASAIVIAFNMGAEGFSARATTLQLAHVVTCICNASGASGEERIFFGSENGKVYEAEKGFSFDGAAIEHYLRLNHFSPFKDIRQEFQLFGVTPHINCDAPFYLQASYELSYGNERHAAAASREKNIEGGGGYYDEADFEETYYDMTTITQTGFPFKGKGTSVSVSLYGNDNLTKSFAVEGMSFDISPRGYIRAY